MLRRAALYDDLTGLPNRTLFRDRLTQAMDRRRAGPGSGFAVLLLDLDGFKLVNDSLGPPGRRPAAAWRWPAGSRVSCATTTSRARLGGDEFAILLEDVADAAGADRASPSACRPPLSRPVSRLDDRADVVVSASIGIAHRQRPATQTPEDSDAGRRRGHVLRRRAAARARTPCSTPPMHATGAGPAAHRAPSCAAPSTSGELELHYQPIVRAGHRPGRRGRGAAALAAPDPRAARAAGRSCRSPRRAA